MTAGGEDLYQAFVSRFLEHGAAEISPEWPEEVRARCLFFVKLAGESRTEIAERSVIASLSDSGAPPGIDLEGAAPAPAAPAVQPPGDLERYVIERELARGGMGRILIAYDRDFRRRIAVKVALAPRSDVRKTSRFLEEAQATAQLEHPNIPPVYDLGVDAAGAPYFTMKWIRGRDLKAIIAAGAEMSLIRQLQVLQQAAMGVHFANTRGVIHRDLKPHNIMVGDFGEVLVVDWGLAKIARRPGEAAAEATPEAAITTERTEGGERTIEGTVQGSLAYMAPEQAWGDLDRVDARTDVFGLGAVLYEILTLTPPRRPRHLQAMLEAARFEPVESPSRRAPERAVPRDLEAACLKSLALEPADRFQTAKELHDALQAYIEGLHDRERRAAEAARLRAIADRHREELAAAEARARELAEAERALRAARRPHEAFEVKRPVWEASAQADAAREAASRAFNQVTAAYQAVLSVEPEDAGARVALAEVYHDRLREAEAAGDAVAAALYEGLVAQYHDGRFALELEGRGLLRLASDPPGAEVLLARYEERRPLLVETAPEAVGRTPLELPLSRGSYLARLRLGGREEVRYPFVIERSGAHEAAVELPPAGSVPAGFAWVPAGESIVGGRAEDASVLPRARVRLPGFLIGRFPVTFAEYCAFLTELAAGGDASLEEHLPFFGSHRYVERQTDGSVVPISRIDPCLPVFAIPFASAVAYCERLSCRLGQPARLPTELEWERAARGADGRLYPWGNEFDWALAKGGLSRPGEPQPEPVGAFESDVSPFGVRDMAGGIRELCDDWYGEGYRVTRGGSWGNPNAIVFRTNWRTQLRDGNRSTDVGFRVALEVR